MEKQFEHIRPYNDQEAQKAFVRIAHSKEFQMICESLLSETPFEILQKEFINLKTIREFHDKFAVVIAKKVMKKTIEELTVSGIERLRKDRAYSFISNHRDIVMDALILQVLYFENIDELIEISFGSNLMMNPLIIDIGKSCLMYKTDRSGTSRELYHKLTSLSDYLQYTITQKKRSTWIAQRNGRTKDGIDRTDPGLIKMYSMSQRKCFKSHFIEMNITPIAISYQYESCDFMKVREIFLKELSGIYNKAKGEDLESILYGINQPKGKVSMVITEPISEKEIASLSDNYTLFCNELTQLVDERVIHNYQLWNNNYIAHDLLHKSADYSSQYSSEEMEQFKSYMHKQLSKITDIDDYCSLEKKFLEIYANPLSNKLSLHSHFKFNN
ncbi:MAG TPA: acyltransferase [Bacteroidales bacterium]|nr:acyltransferase [Bacteroidales bacterium]HOH22169.1 acyltransferase [Bacteroidales bacterium]HPZ02594.1 acyltransferase [Bacteroidales bacterium]HQB74507.1 acyltransferase [Bacteroidales bacterium]